MGWKQDVADGNRFMFGKNWSNFLRSVDDHVIDEAMNDLRRKLGDIKGKTFLDIGSGSGLHSLAAMKLGASRVLSFDYDKQCVACTRELKSQYYADNDHWEVLQGSVLDRHFMEKLGCFDIVYSWGVLHHTGRMWDAIDNACIPVDDRLMIAIYNRARLSAYWAFVKRTYNKYTVMKLLWTSLYLPYYTLKALVKKAVFLRKPLNRLVRTIGIGRGMNFFYDVIDWIGGYPYEYAAPEEVFEYVRKKGFRLEHLTTRWGIGNNVFVFRKERTDMPGPNRQGAGTEQRLGPPLEM